tara:strand:+ start:29303 stop:29989 length:687 start_codon:yes stop_codon:yes gene_type:complete
VLLKGDMRIESKLCYVSENKAVVKVTGWISDKKVGSALAEASTVEAAEDKAVLRLKKRLNFNNENEKSKKFDNEIKIINKERVELPKNQNIELANISHEPSDWSNELTAIDSEIERLNWSRDKEIEFLEKNIGYNNRNKITKYNELVNYLNILKKLDNKNQPKLNTPNIESMIEESELLLKDLSWDYKQGREYLQKEFNVSTRKELDKQQLISFISKLKSIRNQNLSK